MDKKLKKEIRKNTAYNWAAQVVQTISGFLIPRLVDDSLGIEALGAWDFAWSIVSYFNILQLNASSGVSRFVAKHNAKEDAANLNRMVNTSVLLYLVVGACTLVLSFLVPYILSDQIESKLGPLAWETKWAITTLGIYTAIRMSHSSFAGILIGHHRWNIHNIIFMIANAVALVAMAATIMLGGSILHLSISYSAVFIIAAIIRVLIVLRIFPHIKYDFRLASRKSFKTFLNFNSKAMLPLLGRIVSKQSFSVLILMYFGPAALAIYSRPASLVKNLQTFMSKYAMVIMPHASEMKSTNNLEKLRKLTLSMTQEAAYFTLPIILTFAFLGEFILEIWMGKEYANAAIIATLVLATSFGTIHSTLTNVSVGINRYGGIGLISFATYLLSVVTAYVSVKYFHTSLLITLVAFYFPRTLMEAIVRPLILCKQIGLPLRQFYTRVWIMPTVNTLPLVISLYLVVHSKGVSVLVSIPICVASLIYYCLFFRSKIKRNKEAKKQKQIKKAKLQAS